jgi:hypothetical protein
MHFHLPKPLHGWREFVGEVGIIVIGVLIALGAEQIIENLHWRYQVEAGRTALREDVRGLVMNADERELESHCLATRFDQIADILQNASVTHHLPPVGPIGSPSLRPWWVDSWAGLVASQTSLHMPRDEMMAYADIDQFSGMIGKENQAEQDDWSTLHTIVGPGRPFGDAEQASVRKALSHAIYLAKLLKLGAAQLKANIVNTRLLSNRELQTIAKDARRADEANERSSRRRCGPIGPPPPRYDSAPIGISL